MPKWTRRLKLVISGGHWGTTRDKKKWHERGYSRAHKDYLSGIEDAHGRMVRHGEVLRKHHNYTELNFRKLIGLDVGVEGESPRETKRHLKPKKPKK